MERLPRRRGCRICSSEGGVRQSLRFSVYGRATVLQSMAAHRLSCVIARTEFPRRGNSCDVAIRIPCMREEAMENGCSFMKEYGFPRQGPRALPRNDTSHAVFRPCVSAVICTQGKVDSTDKQHQICFCNRLFSRLETFTILLHFSGKTGIMIRNQERIPRAGPDPVRSEGVHHGTRHAL